jgi:hypothetical protein
MTAPQQQQQQQQQGQMLQMTTALPGGATGYAPDRCEEEALDRIERSLRERQRLSDGRGEREDQSASAESRADSRASAASRANKVLPAYRHTPKTLARTPQASSAARTPGTAAGALGRVGSEIPLSMLTPDQLLSRGSKISISSAAGYTPRAAMDVTPAGLGGGGREHEAALRLVEGGGSNANPTPLRLHAPVIGASAPRLRNPTYSCTPSIAELEKMTDRELERLPVFEVSNEHGKIEWRNVDVRNLDLDDIVEIKVTEDGGHEVGVYANEDPAIDKPPVGTGLNKKATVTYYGFHCDYDEVKQGCAEAGMNMLSYDCTTGLLMFTVDHFSRYKLKPSKKPAAEPSVPATTAAASVAYSSDAPVSGAMSIDTEFYSSSHLQHQLPGSQDLQPPASAASSAFAGSRSGPDSLVVSSPGLLTGKAGPGLGLGLGLGLGGELSLDASTPFWRLSRVAAGAGAGAGAGGDMDVEDPSSPLRLLSSPASFPSSSSSSAAAAGGVLVALAPSGPRCVHVDSHSLGGRDSSGPSPCAEILQRVAARALGPSAGGAPWEGGRCPHDRQRRREGGE